jgi:midasin
MAAEGEQQQEEEAQEQPPLPALLQQLEQQLCLHKAAELSSHTASVLAAVAAASNLPPGDAAAEQQRALAGLAAGLAPLLGLLLCALRQLALQYLAVHKSISKLCYITASLFAGLVQEGFCMPEGTEGAYRGAAPLLPPPAATATAYAFTCSSCPSDCS